MPVQKFSAMDPGGSWNMDARDQTAMWSANRGDQWARFNMGRQDQMNAEDWRKEVALKQLGLSEKMWQGGREDSAAERAAKYGFMGEELGLRKEESAADRALRERGFGLQERGFGLQERGMNMQLAEQERLAKQRADEEAALRGLDVSQMGVDSGVYGALPTSLKSQVAIQALTRQLEKARRPEERAELGADIRGREALNIMSGMRGRTDLTPREMQQYNAAKAEAAKQGYGDMGGIEPMQAQAQEFAKQQAQALVAKAKELGGGAFGYVSDEDVATIQSQAQDLSSYMRKAGFPPQDIVNVMQSIAGELAKTRSGLLIKEGWGSEDITSALGVQ